MSNYVQWLNELGMDDVDKVGGKNASLGEMIQNLTVLGVQVPGGFATTAHAYREYLATDGLADRITDLPEELVVAIPQISHHKQGKRLEGKMLIGLATLESVQKSMPLRFS